MAVAFYDRQGNHPLNNGSNVVHVKFRNTGAVWTNIPGKDGSFTNLKGKITLLKREKAQSTMSLPFGIPMPMTTNPSLVPLPHPGALIARLLLWGMLLLPLTAWAQTAEGPLKCPMGRDYWIQLPDNFDADKTYWLVAAIHGYGGDGKGGLGMGRIEGFDNYIIVGPSFPNDGYQVLGQQSDIQLIKLFDQLKTRFHLHDKLFIVGFSGGAQFSHRFAMQHPDHVIGCAAHSGGTWGPEVNPKAAAVPFAVSCGLDDIEPSVGGLPPRIDCAKAYFDSMLKMCATKGACWFKARYWKGVGHGYSQGAQKLTYECYALATSGRYANQDDALLAESSRIQASIGDKNIAEAKAELKNLLKLQGPNAETKTDARSLMTAAEQEKNRERFIAEGIGGPSKNGKEYWIDDGHENVYGWIEGIATKQIGAEALKAHIKEAYVSLQKAIAVAEKQARKK